jgi:hypothetical protein
MPVLIWRLLDEEKFLLESAGYTEYTESAIIDWYRLSGRSKKTNRSQGVARQKSRFDFYFWTLLLVSFIPGRAKFGVSLESWRCKSLLTVE